MRTATLMLMLLAAPGIAGASMTWRGAPEIAVQEAHGSGHRHEGPRSFYLREGEGSEAILRDPTLQTRPLEMIQASEAKLVPTGMDGYHLLFAHREVGGEAQAAFRYVYVPGKPVGRSPAEQLQDPITRLEIVPTPLPREHWRYSSSEPAVFQVRFDRAPLAGVVVRMTTSNGSLLEETSDAKGMVRFSLPEDFSRVGSGRAMNRPADFVVEAAHSIDAGRFVTTLNADYYVNPGHWQSTFAGGAVLVAGFFVGLLAVRPRKENA